MKCAIGLCGHCQWGPVFVCRDGPVFPYDRIKDLLSAWEV
jgi:NAD(P)H-flavin reductase